ncbi:MAG: hypothetical protein ACK5Q5_00930 [Planctomycetaceae bacterium]
MIRTLKPREAKHIIIDRVRYSRERLAMTSCGQVVGTDEAGYGPNLGPLVVSATSWSLPDGAAPDDLWSLLADAVSAQGPVAGRLHIADSKQVYSPSRGLAELERSVLTLLRLASVPASTLSELRAALTCWRCFPAAEFSAPWYSQDDIILPVVVDPDRVTTDSDRLRTALQAAGVRLLGIRSDVVSESRFNRLTDAVGSKGAVLTEATLILARELRHCESSRSTLVLCDKHGGRNRYAGVLSHLLDDVVVQTAAEGREQSIYFAGTTEFRFETKAERHLPVAAASMVSKYVRELSMLAFNQFWRRHQPGLRETKGYPQDAKRFRADIAAAQRALVLDDDLLWRRR